MVVGAKRGTGRVVAGRVTADRVIIGAVRVAADVAVPVKLSAATQIKKNIRFVFIIRLSTNSTPQKRPELL